jgi:hypothetical protein
MFDEHFPPYCAGTVERLLGVGNVSTPFGLRVLHHLIGDLALGLILQAINPGLKPLPTCPIKFSGARRSSSAMALATAGLMA